MDIASFLVLCVFPILALSDKRCAEILHVRSYLVCPSRVQSYLKQRQAVSLSYEPIPRFYFFCRRRSVLFAVYFYLVCFCILQQIRFLDRLRRFRRAVYCAQILFLYLSALYPFVHIPKRRRIFCRNDNARGVSVNTVAERRSERLLAFRIIFPVLRKVRLI